MMWTPNRTLLQQHDLKLSTKVKNFSGNFLLRSHSERANANFLKDLTHAELFLQPNSSLPGGQQNICMFKVSIFNRASCINFV